MSSMSRKRPFGQPRGRLTCLFFVLASFTCVYLILPSIQEDSWQHPVIEGLYAVQQAHGDESHVAIKQPHQEALKVDNGKVQAITAAKKPWEGLRVAVVEQTVYHDEVIGGVVTALHNIQANFTLYRAKLMSGFEEIIKDSYWETPLPLAALESSLTSGEVDVLVMVTCDSLFWGHHASFLDALYNSPSAPQVVCVPHEIEKFGSLRDRALIGPLARQHRLSFMTLVEHASKVMEDKVIKWEQEPSDEFGAGCDWDKVPVRQFAPVYRLPDSVRSGVQAQRSNGRKIHGKRIRLARASILGRMLSFSRRYKEITDSLAEVILDDPQAWGYELLDPKETNTSLIRLVPTSPDAFQLHMIGKPDTQPMIFPPVLLPPEYLEDDGTQKVLPDEHASVIQIHSDTNYPEFYQLIASMDVIIPAFKGQKYLKERASAAIAAAVIAETPVLADDNVIRGYPYLQGPAIVPYDDKLSEIEALKALREDRTGQWVNGQGRRPSKLSGKKARQWESYLDNLRQENMNTWDAMFTDLSQKLGR